MLGVWGIFIFVFIYLLIFQNMYIHVFIIRNRVFKYLSTIKKFLPYTMYAMYVCMFNTQLCKKYSYGKKKKKNPILDKPFPLKNRDVLWLVISPYISVFLCNRRRRRASGNSGPTPTVGLPARQGV